MKPFFFLSCTIILFACADKAETGRNKVEPQDAVFPDYQVWAEEGRDVTVRLQFLAGDADGDAVALAAPATVLLDGRALTADSARFSGTYYEVSKTVNEFRGKHEIVFVDENKKEHRQVFSFEPFELAEELPETVKKKPFSIKLMGLSTEPTPIRLVMVDTALETADVNEELLVKDGTIKVTDELLSRLTKGPVTVEIYREEEKPLPRKGRFSMTFGLRREINLVE